MSSSESSPSLRWKLLRWLFFGVIGVFVLLAGIWGEENGRGQRAWLEYRQKLEAAGEKLDLPAFIPSAVPDEQNFAQTPFLAPLMDYIVDAQFHVVQRNTNAARWAMDFANDLPTSKASGDTREHSRVMDLGQLALEFQNAGNRESRPKKDRDSTTPAPTRPEAAKQILDSLQKYSAVVEELRTAGQRPYSRFNIRYGDGPSTLLPHLAIIKRAALVFQIRAEAELELGQADQALADIKMAIRVSNSITNEPFLICGLVRIATLHIVLQPIWEGLATHRWSEAQLADLQQTLAQFDLLSEFVQVLRGERAGCNDMLNQLRGQKLHPDSLSVQQGMGLPMLPAGWVYQNQVLINRIYQEQFISKVDTANRRLEASDLATAESLDKELTNGFAPHKILARMLVPAIAKTSIKYSFAEVSTTEAMLACALERFRLANGRYPEKLEELLPRYLAKVPHDVVGGGPLHYRLESDGQFTLYSIGWNEKDDGGATGFLESKSGTKTRDLNSGDWVWSSRVGEPVKRAAHP